MAGSRVTLKWTANQEIDLAGYRIYWGTAPGEHPNRVDVGNVTAYTLELPAMVRTGYAVVTAYDAAGNEGAPSEEVPWKVPATVSGLKINRIELVR